MASIEEHQHERHFGIGPIGRTLIETLRRLPLPSTFTRLASTLLFSRAACARGRCEAPAAASGRTASREVSGRMTLRHEPKIGACPLPDGAL